MHALLTLLLLVPAAGGLAAWLVGRRAADAPRKLALLTLLVQLGLLLLVGQEPARFGTESPLLEQQHPWIPSLGISYHLALDGLGLVLLSLTVFLALAAVLTAWREIREREGGFYGLLLLLVCGLTGVFLAVDLVLFYLFWEVMLLPKFFLLRYWGGPGRVRAAWRFLLYTFGGGLVLLLAILGLHLAVRQTTGVATFDLPALLPAAPGGVLGLVLFAGVFLGFAVKLPVFPLHGWLADAHAEAPLASVVLGGAMLKAGGFGLIRFALPLFPAAALHLQPLVLGLGVATILYGGLLACAATDLRRIAAYASLAGMGFVLLGIGAGNELGLQGAVVGMVAHGLIAGALFALWVVLRAQTGTLALDGLGGLWHRAPRLSGFTLFFALAALGLPGLAGFVGEFLVLLGTFRVSPAAAALAVGGLVISAVFALRLVQRTVHGPLRVTRPVTDLAWPERVLLGLFALLLLLFGLHPQPLLDASQAPLAQVARTLAAGEPQPPVEDHPEVAP